MIRSPISGTERSATDPTAFAYTTTAGSKWAYIFRTDSGEARIRQVQPGTSGAGPANTTCLYDTTARWRTW
ncbi:hypothetical protein [Streptomyces sp. NPDC048825]|uniref:hypothetical protein n=1 Tax=Streptomyces sp. NPDC048825 TaxID=3365592 RepID=UPI00371E2405